MLAVMVRSRKLNKVVMKRRLSLIGEWLLPKYRQSIRAEKNKIVVKRKKYFNDGSLIGSYIFQV